jgi:hypothetical protein
MIQDVEKLGAKLKRHVFKRKFPSLHPDKPRKSLMQRQSHSRRSLL